MAEQHNRIVFTGDIAFSRYFKNAWKDNGCLSEGIMQYLDKANYVVANVECPLTTNQIKSKRPLNHMGDPHAGEYLRRMNILNWTLANNHIMDCEADGLRDTLRCAEENGCQAIGAGENEAEASRPLILGDEVKVGILAVAGDWAHVKAGKDTPGALTIDKTDIIADAIRELRKTVDWVVVAAHNGDEYTDLVLPYRREQYIKLLKLGADIVVGHHPHVVQQYEYFGKKLIVYSLGNFIFDTEHQRNFKHTDTGMLIGIDFKKNGFTMDLYPTRINREEKRIEEGTIPAVFQNISDDEYSKLWPLAAYNLNIADMKNRKLLSKWKLYDYRIMMFMANVYKCRQKPYRSMQIGRFLSVFGQWKKTTLPDVVKYMRE